MASVPHTPRLGAASALFLSLSLLGGCGGGGDSSSSPAAAPAAAPAPGTEDICRMRWFCPAPTPAPAPSPAPFPAPAPSPAPAPAPAPVLATRQVGIYVGNDTALANTFDTWLGRRTDGVLSYAGYESWTNFDDSIPWLLDVWGPSGRQVYWSIPLMPMSSSGATLAQAAAGDYNSHYRVAAERLLASSTGGRIIVRVGWNANGDWVPWTAQGRPAQYIGAFRQLVQTFRAAALARGTPNRFAFEWNVVAGEHGMNPADAYPGDDVVDLIGMDFRYDPAWDPVDPVQAWNEVVGRPYGLQWHQTFAAQHGKKTSYSTWGVRGDNAGPYIQRAKAWFDQYDVVYEVYWNWGEEALSDGHVPTSGSAYRVAFGP